ncbi:hypothetical protein VUJ46_07090 [Chryseobacterium sp. MYb264]|uniref:hypothetical protein n=1 Tax=Chryseobacterium sp. MYb264 TaxID=2745153 RepID=UPI002E1467D7|nr:hypothetical protein VUJ46_07090 [Chryseobacterium sp. MYb264]
MKLYVKILAALTLLVFYSDLYGQLQYKRSYQALLETNIKDRTDGSCEVSHYTTFKFEKKGNVDIIYMTNYSCNPKEIEKNYVDLSTPIKTTSTYQIKNNKIYIKDFQYSPLLIGKKELIYNNIIFKLEK